ncbi:circularly permuted type 2 ATP-grasp protein [Algibacter amylolyticus]|uniref:Circularly permuted type 2 ATP-grasp protein n=1 Tax=Algibacter amylolyticus TaxID=1608400 RepID=A0A5M7B9Q6_9FLAO|nr:circularly permuted type 2 ATP-grasp protein [Algibacter amylolyticus]KAA5826306.1 circularly permuted type 2 ATP-grasp protein [Algibacter amylolyticus]MBB5268509.1 putative circularly permuted ATP-grasp superfamily protein [Algibacter amylolyticus]TSJ80344.1 circularly permuted type 2 ATP-grasp protein [Algibacter amylolyticus]
MAKTDLFSSYDLLPKTWDEMYNDSSVFRTQYEEFITYLENTSSEKLTKKEDLAKQLFMSQGVTFTVYNDNEGIEKIFPFDIVPRIITSSEWNKIESGIKQRLKALNLFIKDIYNEQFIIKDGIVPGELIYSCPNYLREMKGVKVPHDIYVHISGVDLIRNNDGEFYVLEDNLRTPSGVSYMLENREISKRLFPGILPKSNVRSVSNYPNLLYKKLKELSNKPEPNIVLLTPGIYNSAYYEHTTLARLMGIELVEGSDLVVKNHYVYMKTTNGLKQVDVIYRRVDDDFLDPLEFNEKSVLGVAGIMAAYRKGHVNIVNAPGTGIADDKAIYIYVPDMIKYYLGEEPILKNIETYQLGRPDELDYVTKNIKDMVIKKTDGSGGYGMLMGHEATKEEIKDYLDNVKKKPENFIAQPILRLSTAPCYIDGKLSPRCIDLRPFALTGKDGIDICPGGLTRVALKKGSLVVNSSQGGGSKDTWVIE